jgi:hypothetical protein
LEGILRRVGAQRLAQPEQPRSKHRRILKKSSPCAAHLDLLDFLVLPAACFAEEKWELSRHSIALNFVWLGSQAELSPVAGPACSWCFRRDNSDSKDTPGCAGKSIREVMRWAKIKIGKLRGLRRILLFNCEQYSIARTQAGYAGSISERSAS